MATAHAHAVELAYAREPEDNHWLVAFFFLTELRPPGVNLPNLDDIRNAQPQQPKVKAPIESNLMCADCDAQGGGGGATYYPSGDPNFSTARRRPVNETGQAGVDLGSRNFNWSLSLLELPGRAGLDLNLVQLARVDQGWELHEVQRRSRLACSRLPSRPADTATALL